MTEDWSSSMMSVEQQIKHINHKLLHQNYDGIDANILTVIQMLTQVRIWVIQERERKFALEQSRRELQAQQS